MGTKANIVFGDIKIPTSAHPEIKKLKNKNNIHQLHGNKVWNSTLVTIDILEELDILYGNVADLGCGWGVLSHYMQKKGCDVTGYDLDKNVEPYFKLMSKLMDVYPKFSNTDIFSKKLSLDFDIYIASDVCFWEEHILEWVRLIDVVTKAGKTLVMIDPGRASFWSLLEMSPCPYEIERRFIKEPRKTDAYIVMFGE